MSRTAWKALLALVVGLIGAEIALRIAIGADGALLGHPLPPYEALTNARQRGWLALQQEVQAGNASEAGPGVFDAELGWTVLASSANRDRTVVTNSIGARSAREYAPMRGDGVLRLACFGDSFTWCDEVANEETWEAQLEALDPAIEALNFGVAAYGTDQALLRFRRDGTKLDADVVCVGLLLENIGRNVNRYRPLWFPNSGSAAAKPRFLAAGGALELVPHGFATQAELLRAIGDGSVGTRLAEHEHWLDKPALGCLRHSAIARLAGAFVADREREVRDLWLDRRAEPFKTTLALLEEFDREGRASGARTALVLVFPRKPDLEELLRSGDCFWAGLLSDLDGRAIPVLDLAEPLAVAARREGVDRLYIGGHLSRAGNEVVARAVRDWLGRGRVTAER
jgi:hypothetical protein